MGGKPRVKPAPRDAVWLVQCYDESYDHHVFYMTREDALKAAALIESCDDLELETCELCKPPKAGTLAEFCEFFDFDPPE